MVSQYKVCELAGSGVVELVAVVVLVLDHDDGEEVEVLEAEDDVDASVVDKLVVLGGPYVLLVVKNGEDVSKYTGVVVFKALEQTSELFDELPQVVGQ